MHDPTFARMTPGLMRIPGLMRSGNGHGKPDAVDIVKDNSPVDGDPREGVSVHPAYPRPYSSFDSNFFLSIQFGALQWMERCHPAGPHLPGWDGSFFSVLDPCWIKPPPPSIAGEQCGYNCVVSLVFHSQCGQVGGS